ncbi:MAG: hypothetical protein IPM63_12330 [Acidobacteriota bacterium]|nr:MAG: hypothetical protein IPM63_12330 [Acidobacteriota bacterium]
MRKLVLGIAMVVCLDAAFIWMMSMEAEIPEMTHVVVPRAAVPLIREKNTLERAVISDSEELQDHEPVSSARVARRAHKLQPTTSAARIKTSGTEEIQDPSVNAKRLFQDKIIYIGQYETYGNYKAPQAAIDNTPPKGLSKSEALSAEKAPKARKRSFESRAFGVIKKPYKWIKALASKFGN